MGANLDVHLYSTASLTWGCLWIRRSDKYQIRETHSQFIWHVSALLVKVISVKSLIIPSKYFTEIIMRSRNYWFLSHYNACPKRYRTFEIARRWAGAGRLRRWCCVAGTLSFILTLATSRHFQLIMSYPALSERVFIALGDFFASWRMKDLEEQRVCVKFCFKLGKNLYGDFSDVATGSWGGLFEPYAMLRVVSAFQIGQNVHRRRSQIWTAFFVNGRRSHWESAFCDTWKSSSNYPWSFRRSRQL